MFGDKYNLTREQSIFLAKKTYDQNIFCGMKMENRNVTFPETQVILNGINVPNVKLDDILAIRNMKKAWQYLLSTIDDENTIEYLCRLNLDVSREESLDPGVLRYGNVGIGGTDYIPEIPKKDKVSTELEKILTKDGSITSIALDIFLWGVRNQLFWDGNKRTSLMMANKVLIQSGKGMLTIQEKDMLEFTSLLQKFFSSGESEELKKYLYDNAIVGIEINP